MVFGDFGGRGTNPNPVRTFASTKHSPVIVEIFNPGCVAARAMGQFGRFHPKRVDNPVKVAFYCVGLLFSDSKTKRQLKGRAAIKSKSHLSLPTFSGNRIRKNRTQNQGEGRRRLDESSKK